MTPYPSRSAESVTIRKFLFLNDGEAGPPAANGAIRMTEGLDEDSANLRCARDDERRLNSARRRPAPVVPVSTNATNRERDERQTEEEDETGNVQAEILGEPIVKNAVPSEHLPK